MKNHLLPLGLLASIFAGPSCTSSDVSVDLTESTIILTDAATDDIDMFEVDVKNVTLTKLSGQTVTVTSLESRIDFAQLETVGELLVGQRIPVGVYRNLSMTLDFSDAAVCLVGQTTPATILDGDGNQITGEVSVSVAFASNARPNLVVNRNHMFVLDLDLNQSVTVGPGNQITFSPVVTAEVDPTNPKPIFMQGLLQSIDSARSELTVERRGIGGVALGTYTVSVGNATIYQIDGTNSVGSSGLTALQGVPGTPRIMVQGTLSPTERKFNALAVESGNGIPGNGQDFVIGHITARDNSAGSDATLTVIGFSEDDPAGTRRFNTTHTINVSLANTKVLRRLNSTSLDTDALNVGQRIAAFGTLSGTTLDATANTAIVRTLDTSVWGTATGAPASGTMTLNLSRIGRRSIGSFNFTVNGNSQSTATAYEVGVGTLSTTGVTNGTKMRAIGVVNDVDVNGDDDFTAATLVNHSTTASVLVCQWAPPLASAIAATSSTNVQLDVSSALIKTVGDGFGNSTLTTSPTPRIEPLAAAGVYRIVENGAIELHLSFENFATALASRVSATSPVFRVGALGTYDQSTQTFDALVVSVILR